MTREEMAYWEWEQEYMRRFALYLDERLKETPLQKRLKELYPTKEQLNCSKMKMPKLEAQTQ